VADDLIRAVSKVRFLGVPVEAHESLGSTNDEAFRRAEEGAPQGLVVLARHQTAGKGRLGRTWFDQPDRSLLFSILLQPTIPIPSYPLLSLTLAASVAAELADINQVALRRSKDVALDSLILRLHTETAYRRGRALGLRLRDVPGLPAAGGWVCQMEGRLKRKAAG